MNWKAQLGIGLFVVGIAVAGVWLWRDSVWRERLNVPAVRDTVTVVAPYVPPKPTVKPNPAPVVKVIRDRAREDSLLSQISNRDSLMRFLLSTVGTQQRFTSTDPTGLDISGDLTILYSPIERHFATDIVLDTVHISVNTITITQTIVEERVNWLWVAVGYAAGIVTVGLVAR